MGVEPTRNGATIRRVNHFTTATKLFPNLIAWRQIVLYYTNLLSSSIFCELFYIFFCSSLLSFNEAASAATYKLSSCDNLDFYTSTLRQSCNLHKGTSRRINLEGFSIYAVDSSKVIDVRCINGGLYYVTDREACFHEDCFDIV